MKVSIQHDMPHDEFVQKFGAIAGATYDEAHAALLRAQGIKPVSVETSFGSGQPAMVAQQPALPAPQIIGDQTDLTPLYGIFIQLADAVTETRQRLEEILVTQEHINQQFATNIDDIYARLNQHRDVINENHKFSLELASTLVAKAESQMQKMAG